MAASQSPSGAPSLEEVRARIDAVDSEILRLVDERASLAAAVAAAKKQEANGGPVPFGLRPARETQVIRKLLARSRVAATPSLIVRIWRELIGDSLSRQGPFSIVAWTGKSSGRVHELARMRFGAAPDLTMAARPEQVYDAARKTGVVGVVPIEAGEAAWARLLAEPKLKAFAVMPCLSAWGPPGAIAFADVAGEPSGADQTLWATDSKLSQAAIIDALSGAGLAADLIVQGGALKLFALAGFVQADDPRLATAPGDLKGVIGWAPTPFDI